MRQLNVRTRSSHYPRARNERKRNGKIFGTLGCLGRWRWLQYYSTTSQIQGLLRCLPYASTEHALSSIQAWALKEAKERMEAREEKYKYESSS